MTCLTLTCSGEHAPDLGFLLHKHPDSIFVRELSFGRVIVFYPENTPTRATAAMLVEVDAIGLVRGRSATLEEYVNDRPYALSSLTSVAMNTAFGTALAGRSKERAELVNKPLLLEAHLSAVHSRGGPELIRKIFAPLGYEMEITPITPAIAIPFAARSPIYSVRLHGTVTVHDLLSHLYVLIPVLDDAKHYFVAADEVKKLLEHGGTWLENHPAKNLITRRYLAYQHSLVREALSQLKVESEVDERAAQAEEERLEEEATPGMNLHEQRHQAVLAALRAPLRTGVVQRVADLGCGEGKFLQSLLAEKQLREIAGVDVSAVALKYATRRLHYDRLSDAQRERLKLLHGSLLYRDQRLEGFDAATLIEVIEHIPPERLDLLRRVLFASIRPRRLIITTPNREFNVHFTGMKEGQMRHRDHRFEWTRAEFESRCREAATQFGYDVKFAGVGPEMPNTGALTQMAVFELKSEVEESEVRGRDGLEAASDTITLDQT
ncbi:3' terminal RNA ribose 2'-O-methyltransferase Hen1 [candidate division KSB1 bacterium]|nr:3' terminal RNA ribose 2'-O-methyltransferase Hen1 [candidate division KSB1 bacterium]